MIKIYALLLGLMTTEGKFLSYAPVYTDTLEQCQMMGESFMKTPGRFDGAPFKVHKEHYRCVMFSFPELGGIEVPEDEIKEGIGT